MQVFTSEELQRRPADVQQSALVEPTMITFHGKPRLVILSIDEFDRLRGRRPVVLDAVELSDDIVADMRKIADAHSFSDADLGLLGGLLGQDQEPPIPR